MVVIVVDILITTRTERVYCLQQCLFVTLSVCLFVSVYLFVCLFVSMITIEP